MKLRSAISASAALVTVVALAGCSSPTTGSAAAQKLTIALGSAPISLDPSKAAIGLYSNYAEPAYASLLNLTSSGQIAAGLAAKWGYTGSDNTVFEMTLRKGVKWADGTPITAAQAVASIQYFAKGTGGASPFLGGLTFTAPSSDVIQVTSPAPNPALAQLFTPQFLAGAIISPAGLKDPTQLAAKTFGAGEYVYSTADSVAGDHYTYKPNKHYWSQSSIHFKAITVRVISNPTSAAQALKSGQIDFSYANQDSAASVAGSTSVKVISAPAIWAGLFLLDRDGKVVPALKDVRVRQALNYAVDRESITKAIYGKFGTPVDQAQIPGFDGYSTTAESRYPYDPAKAKALLSAAGYAEGFTLPVNYGTFDTENTRLVQAVASDLAKVGVKLTLKSAPDFGTWVTDYTSRKYAATVLSPGEGAPQFLMSQAQFSPRGILNIFGSTDPKVTAAMDALASATPEEHDAKATAVADAATEAAMELPIAAADGVDIYSTKLKGVSVIKGLGQPTYVTSWSK